MASSKQMTTSKNVRILKNLAHFMAADLCDVRSADPPPPPKQLWDLTL